MQIRTRTSSGRSTRRQQQRHMPKRFSPLSLPVRSQRRRQSPPLYLNAAAFNAESRDLTFHASRCSHSRILLIEFVRRLRNLHESRCNGRGLSIIFCTRRASPPVPKTGSHLSSCLLGAQNGLSSHFGSLPGSYLRAAYAFSQSKMTFRSIHEPSRRVISKDQVLESYVAHAKGTVSICHGHTKR